jgi:hypothetical protein
MYTLPTHQLFTPLNYTSSSTLSLTIILSYSSTASRAITHSYLLRTPHTTTTQSTHTTHTNHTHPLTYHSITHIISDHTTTNLQLILTQPPHTLSHYTLTSINHTTNSHHTTTTHTTINYYEFTHTTQPTLPTHSYSHSS